ncbi:MAG: DMT family transporter [Pseudomonadota bacterium]
MTAPHFVLFVTIMIVWALNTVVTKAALGEIPPFTFSALRFGFLALILIPLVRLHVRQMGLVLGIGLTAGTFHFGFLFLGLSLSTASVTNIVLQMSIPLTTLLSILILKEEVGWRRWIAIFMSFVGVLILAFDPVVFGYVVGVLFVLIGALSYGLSSIILKQVQDIGVLQLQAWVAWVSFPSLLLASVLFEPGALAMSLDASVWAWVAVVFTALGASLFGHTGFYFMVRRYDLSLVYPLTLMAPVFGVLFSIWLLDEDLTVRILIGAVLIFFSVLIIVLRQGRAPASGAKAAAVDPVVPSPKAPGSGPEVPLPGRKGAA